MIIKSLILNDFRQYIGHQTIEFSTDPERNVTVLIGINTAGKTTLIRAFEWILYNKNEFKDKVLLNSEVAENMSEGETHTVRGVLSIEHNGTEYIISRTQIYTCAGRKYDDVLGKKVPILKGAPSKAQIEYLQADGQTKTKIESDFESNIEKILPKNLSNYFFFGGERLANISSREDIESSVKGIMQLDVLANAMTDLKKVINKFKKGMDYSQSKDAKETQERLEVAIAKKESLEDEISNAEDQIAYYEEQKEIYATLLRNHQDTAEKQKRRETVENSIKNATNNISRAKKDIVSTFSRNAFAYFSLPILKEVITMLDSASADFESVPDMTADAIDYIIKRGYCICGTHISPGSAAEINLLKERAKQPPEHIGALIRRYREQAMEYVTNSETYYDDVNEKITNLREHQRQLNFRLDEKELLDKQIEDSVNISEYEKNYKSAINQLNKWNSEKDLLNGKKGSCEKDIQNYESALDKFNKANKKNQKISAYIDYAQETYDWISVAYLNRENLVRSSLESKVNGNFQKMYHGYRTVEIDEKYRVKYKDVVTDESDGLKAVKSFAFVSGLVDLAKESLNTGKDSAADVGPQYYPLVMDAPFSNVDEIHIENISKLLPKSASQVIMAVMKKDWEPASKVMAPFVGMSYVIEKAHDANENEIDTITHIRKEH